MTADGQPFTQEEKEGIQWYIRDNETYTWHEIDSVYYFNLKGKDEWGLVQIRPIFNRANGQRYLFEPQIINIDVLDYGIYALASDGTQQKFHVENLAEFENIFDPSKKQ